MTGDMPEVARRRGRRRGELSMATIARLAGVSPPVVSRVLNGRPGVAAATRRRIEELLREQGYRRPTMVTPSPGVEVVFYQLLNHLTVEIMRGVKEAVQDHDLQVGFTDVRDANPNDRPWTERLLAQRPAGVITALPDPVTEQHAQLAAGGIPVVVLDPNRRPPPGAPSVTATNWGGAVDAAHHVLDLGHRRIGVLGGPGSALFARERLEGCRAAVEVAGVPLDPDLVRTGDYTFEAGTALGRELLSLSRPPTALLCGNDMQALGVYVAARQLGLRIPQDLSVVGFDDIEPTLWCDPPLTTVHQPFREMGSAAAHLLLTLIAGQTPVQPRVELSTVLVVRGSTAPPPATG